MTAPVDAGKNPTFDNEKFFNRRLPEFEVLREHLRKREETLKKNKTLIRSTTKLFTADDPKMTKIHTYNIEPEVPAIGKFDDKPGFTRSTKDINRFPALSILQPE